MKNLPIVLVLLSVVPVLAQESASYKLNEHTFNAGGAPSGGVTLASASYKISLAAIGEGVVRAGPAGSAMDGGFCAAYPPPGEVLGLRFTDSRTLVWDPEPSLGLYNLYRGLVDGLDGTVYGSCEEPEIAVTTTTDDDPVPTGDGHFYLVSAQNRLSEEGTLGRRSSGSSRLPQSTCP